MAALCRNMSRLGNLVESKAVLSLWPEFVRSKFTKPRIPAKMFEVDPADHEKYNGDPNQPHQLHIITRIKCTRRRPYWEKKIVHDLGLDKVMPLYRFHITRLEIIQPELNKLLGIYVQ